MKTVAKKFHRRSGKVKEGKMPAVARFWVRKANPELDRSGDWLLNNLNHLRREASTRADPF